MEDMREEKRDVREEIAPEQFNYKLMFGTKFVYNRVVNFAY